MTTQTFLQTHKSFNIKRTKELAELAKTQQPKGGRTNIVRPFCVNCKIKWRLANEATYQR